ncbi:MAG: prepilin-type N-terminal cleavage/methylation domain-containing protein [Lachnospiraceae bacterium]|nr:prepilin-type N-terminal cleavage/methylation domain-containing protein [Lachnospiraceae bacterium]
MKKSKQDNSGFTLIELLIAMVIIAIVLTPLYNNFRQSTYLNGKAKAAMDATNMASNVMEGLSAYSAEEIILGFYSYDSVSNNNPLRHSTLNIMPNEVTVAAYGDVEFDGTSYSKHFVTTSLPIDSSATYADALYASAIGGSAPQPLARFLQVNPNTKGRYYFYAEGVTQARGTYDVLLVLDASGESTGFSGDLDDDGVINAGAGETVGYNDYESPVLTNINPMYDGVYTETSSQRANAAAEFMTNRTNLSSSIDSEEKVCGIMRRTMTINVEKVVGASGETIVVTLVEKYKLMSNTADFSINEYTLPVKTLFDSSTYGATPRNIYIYYTGNYKSTNKADTSCLDIFEINNLDHIPININLIRIKSAETSDSTELTYRARIHVNEAKTGGTYATEIYSNLRDDLSKTAAQNASNRTDNARSGFSLNGTPVNNDSADYLDLIHENGGVRTEKRDRLYAVTMYVYQEGAADQGFPEELLITEFDGNSAQ